MNGGSQRHEVERAAKAVSGLKGVTRVEPNYLSRQLFVEYDPDHVTMEEIRRAVKSHPGRKTGLP